VRLEYPPRKSFPLELNDFVKLERDNKKKKREYKRQTLAPLEHGSTLRTAFDGNSSAEFAVFYGNKFQLLSKQAT
jgi:hypothetical protein